jgi:hypothetical protein
VRYESYQFCHSLWLEYSLFHHHFLFVLEGYVYLIGKSLMMCWLVAFFSLGVLVVYLRFFATINPDGYSLFVGNFNSQVGWGS